MSFLDEMASMEILLSRQVYKTLRYISVSVSTLMLSKWILRIEVK